MPQKLPAVSIVPQNIGVSYAIGCCIDLDSGTFCGLNIFTSNVSLHAGSRRCRRSTTASGSKTEALLEEGTLNPTPEKVRDPKFQGSEFFDPHDIVQVKYEMLRRVSVENASVHRRHRGVRRFEADILPDQGQLRRGGIAGLVPQEARARTAP